MAMWMYSTVEQMLRWPSSICTVRRSTRSPTGSSRSCDDGVRGLAVVLEGEVSAVCGEHAAGRLGAGEMLGSRRRCSAWRQASIVVKRPGTQLLRSALERVRGTAEPTAIWQTLARALT